MTHVNHWNQWQQIRGSYLRGRDLEEQEVKRIMRLEYQAFKGDNSGPPSWLARLTPEAVHNLRTLRNRHGTTQRALEHAILTASNTNVLELPIHFNAVQLRGAHMDIMKAEVHVLTSPREVTRLFISLHDEEDNWLGEFLLSSVVDLTGFAPTHGHNEE